MKSKKFFGKSTTIIIIVLAVLILSLLVTISNQRQNQLPAYQNTETAGSPVATVYQEDCTEYISDVLPYSINVPSAWRYVVQDNCPAFVNEADGATVKFINMPYDPTINMVSKATLEMDINNANGTLIDFAKISASSYLSLYEISGIYYLEYTVWDRCNIVRIVFMYRGEDASYYTEYAKYLLESFNWERADPIPDGYYIYYNEFGNFEFGVPEAWDTYIDNGMFTAISPNQSYMICSVTKSENSFQNIDIAQFVEIYLPNVTEYNVITFQNTGAVIVAEISYYANNVEYRFVGNAATNNGYIYEFALLCSTNYYSTDGAAYMQSLELFQVF